MDDPRRESYEDLPYPSGAFALTHPWRVGLVGRCFGVATAAPAGARVLELGAGTGWNASLIAWSLPDAEVVAIDREPRHVAEGIELAARLGVRNCHIRVGDFVTLDPAALGTFDYVICHGVYGWVPAGVRDRLMALARATLAPGGVFYLATNVLPGSAARDAVSAMLRHRVRAIPDAGERLRVAREFLLRLAAEAPEITPWWSAALTGEADYVRQSPPDHLAHEHLSPVSHALHVTELVAHARAHGLAYLADAQMSAALGHGLPEPLRDELARSAADPIDHQQLLDFATGRVFRRALFVRDDEPGARATPDAAPLVDAWLLTGARRAQSGGWELGARTLEPSRWALHRAMTAMAAAWPEALPFAEVARAAGDEPALLAEDLLELWQFGLMDPLLGAPLVGAADASDGGLPRLSPAALIEIGRGHHHVTTLHHAPLSLSTEDRAFARLVDGARDRAELARLGGPDALARLGRMALLARR
ncbi:MAG: methyltransferase regulatory domain-containing protein [Deltaproteobacteria bacterium]|nr:methyltransferase regulatory domain-containing protein [Deltaproteobacteria bacterium]